MKYDVAVLTDVGLVRANNEDAYLIDKDLHLFILADGMGGYQKGEVASLMTCQGVAEYFRERLKNNISDFNPEDFRKAVHRANSDIRTKIREIAGLDKMGSTVVFMLLKKDRIFVGNVGDSRAYVFRHDKLEQISVDHSLIQETKNAGLKKELANQFKNIVTRAVGMKDSVDPDVFTVSAHAGDKFLLCSDGLHGFVSDEKISGILGSEGSLNEQMDHLVREAKQGGGKDNITGILLQVHEDLISREGETQPFRQRGSDEEEEMVSSFYVRLFLGFILLVVLVTLVILVI